MANCSYFYYNNNRESRTKNFVSKESERGSGRGNEWDSKRMVGEDVKEKLLGKNETVVNNLFIDL